MKIDLHVHSKHSTRPSQWVLQKLGCPESFTEPRRIYDIARAKGMDLVTISDHNKIEGSLAIADLPGTFVSEEITSYFPEDRCKCHILALDINEPLHREIQKIRENVYDLVEFLRRERIHHVVAHPLFGVNDRITVEHFEKMLLLFRNFELNGTRDEVQNVTLRTILSLLDQGTIDHLADKHGLDPYYPEPWRKSLTGGSDDHSGLGIARIHTEVEGAATLHEFLRGMELGNGRAVGQSSTPQTMAHNLYSIAYQFYKHKLKIDRYVSKDVFLKFVDRFLEPGPHADAGMILRLQAALGNRKILRRRREEPRTVQEIVRAEAERIILGDPKLVEFSKSGHFGQLGQLGQSGLGGGASESLERNWFAFATKATNRVSALFADRLLDHVAGANVFDIFGSIGSAGALYTLLAPYFVAYSIFTKDRQVSNQALDRFLHRGRPRTDRAVKVAHFTDTFYEVNGVAKTLQLQTEFAAATGRNLTVVTCGHDERDVSGVRNFEPIGVYSLPEYPAQKIFYPPILEMLDYVFTEGFTHIHSATPGPIGLAALLIARILKLPIHGTYHTAIPQYAQYLTGDEAMEELMWRFMTWYYGQLDIVYVPSKATAAELAGKGIPKDKLVLFPRGVDTARFHPAKRNGYLAKKHNITDGQTLLYVGRVSREKNLHLLAEAYVSILSRHPATNLVIVGDGPFLDEMKTLLQDTPTVFTGYQDGEDLSQIYASSDIFIFPSTTDTFGNVVLEAQASGLPIIVTDGGGPRENILPGMTGLVVPGGDASALASSAEALLADPERLATMGMAARAFMEERTFEQAFAQTWDLYTSSGHSKTA